MGVATISLGGRNHTSWESAPHGCLRAPPVYGRSRVLSWSAQDTWEIPRKDHRSQFPTKAIASSSAGLTTMGIVQASESAPRGHSPNRRSSPARRERQTVTGRAFRRCPSGMAGSITLVRLWDIPACRHCRMRSWRIARAKGLHEIPASLSPDARATQWPAATGGHLLSRKANDGSRPQAHFAADGTPGLRVKQLNLYPTTPAPRSCSLHLPWCSPAAPGPVALVW